MSNDILERPLQSRAAIIIACLLFALIGGVLWLWWQEKGLFKQPIHGQKALVGVEKIQFVYDDKDAKLAPFVMQNDEWGDWYSSTRLRETVALRNSRTSLRFTNLLVGREKEVQPDAKTLSDIDSEIRRATQQAILSVGIKPEEGTTKRESASFWQDTSVEPFRLLVHVKKRFEKDKCIFWVDAELQRGARIFNSMKQPIYVPVYGNSELDYREFTEVPTSDAKQAIGQQVAGAVKEVLDHNR